MMNTLKNITLKTKLRFLLVVLLGLMWTAVGIGINKMQLIGSEMTAITDNDIPLTEVITQVTTNQLEQAVHFERIVRLGEEIANRHGADGAFKQEINQFNALSNKIDEAIKRGESVAQKAIANTGIQATATEFTRVTSLLKDIEAQHALYEKHAHDVFNSFGISGLENTLHLMEKVDAQEKAIDQKLEELLTQIEKFTEKASLKAQQDEHTALQLLIALGIAATVIGLAISLPIISVINRGITRAMEAANYVANGDLSKEIKSDSTDEIGQLLTSLERMRTNLCDMVSELTSSSTQLATAAEELSVVTGETNQNVLTQQSEIEQAVTAINEMSATIQEVAKNAANTSETASQTHSSTADGQQVVQLTVSAIGELATEIENTSEVINRLEVDSESISGILDVIKNIAEQTNLLALNAAIEAARAGEQGRGFAVVADEVRTLASRTQDSTLEIEEMIEKLQTGSRNAVAAMESSKEHATASVKHANDAGAALDTITSSVSTISDMNSQIAAAAEEQSIVTEDINRNIAKVNDITARTADGAKETTAASEELAQLATNMNNLALKFVV